jgi:hypothetical protein
MAHLIFGQTDRLTFRLASLLDFVTDDENDGNDGQANDDPHAPACLLEWMFVSIGTQKEKKKKHPYPIPVMLCGV